MTIFGYIIIGLIAGFCGGALGLGGGAIMVPLLVMWFGLTQHQAQGTALTVMLIPVFWLAVWRYYQAGNVKVQIALFIAIGFVVGALLGAHAVQYLPSEQLKKIFVPFFTTKAQGSGLGLPLCQQIIEQHSGHIEVKSENKKGTTFSVYLPV